MYCPYCGSENRDEQHFCGQCGKPLHRLLEENRTPEDQGAPEKQTEPKKRKGVRRKVVIPVGIGLLGICLVALVLGSRPKESAEWAPRTRAGSLNGMPRERVEQSYERSSDEKREARPQIAIQPVQRETKAPREPAEVLAVPETPEVAVAPVARRTRQVAEEAGLTPILGGTAHAASWLDEGKYKHPPSHVLDNDPATAWCSDRKNPTNVLRIDWDGTIRSVSGMVINAGYHKSEDLYDQNARPRTIQVTCDGEGGTYEIALEDEMTPQILYLPERVRCQSLELKIVDFYAGSRYQDICISDITVFQ